MARILLIFGVAVALIACSSNNTTTVVVAPGSSASTTIGHDLPSAASPSTHAIDRVCSILTVHVNTLSAALDKKALDANGVEDDFAIASQQLRQAAPALAGTQAASDIAGVNYDVDAISQYNSADVEQFKSLLRTFATDVKAFDNTYCKLF